MGRNHERNVTIDVGSSSKSRRSRKEEILGTLPEILNKNKPKDYEAVHKVG